MLLSESFETRADVVKLVDLVQDRFKNHGYTALSLRNLRREDFRWTGLGQRPERGEGGNHPTVTVRGSKMICWSELTSDRFAPVTS